MSSNMMVIGKSGAAAARAALELTAQNIANTENATYARRSIQLSEVTATGGIGLNSSSAPSGVRTERVNRVSSAFLLSEARRTESDVTRADAELLGMREQETAIEKAGIFEAGVDFESALSQLVSDPLDPSLRTQVVEEAETLVQTFAIAVEGLDASTRGLHIRATEDVTTLNVISQELARNNIGLSRSEVGTSNHAALLDKRDALLSQMSTIAGIRTEFDSLGRVSVRLAGGTEPLLVLGAQSEDLEIAIAADGTLEFATTGGPTTVVAGRLSGSARALDRMVDVRTSLDDIASSLITTVNAAQANGVTKSGAAAPPMFTGAGARDIALAITDGADLATAPTGSGPNSRDTSNLDSLRSVLAGPNGPAAQLDALLLQVSSAIDGRSITRDALRTLADTASVALSTETGVDLDTEAANLVRYQQAYQASGRVIQVAAEIFDTMLGIR
ncbi:flagellar hook-associated protein FlgK [Croceicoccus hydrothermalis]|uniref:flagellar hook-associated protein FlgK n=1 Tax=Croceicoccus hydrothermalis TaxID=2867964 RepID=UPI001EFA9195|nr:flagellar hook-associated protein FlgK [Croceicoccus hydrothermalis]